jgi:hypothetical protein
MVPLTLTRNRNGWPLHVRSIAASLVTARSRAPPFFGC